MAEGSTEFAAIKKIAIANDRQITLSNGSLIKGETISCGSNNKINGTGDRTSMLKATTAIEIQDWGITFSGNMVLTTSKIQTSSTEQYKFEAPAELSAKADIVIAGGCTNASELPPAGYNPADPIFPIIVENKNYYTILFEDQWPFYGDYDMNDAVLEVSGLKYEINSNNKVGKVTFKVTLKAVGASRQYAIAVMLDKIDYNNISTISCKPKQKDPKLINKLTFNGLEEGETNAVIPLFDCAHDYFTLTDNEYLFVNTLVGSSNNTSTPPTLEVTVNLKNSVDESCFNINHMNFFLVTGQFNGEGKRREVHLAGFQPTKFIDTMYFGNNDDASSTTGNYFVSKENLAWGIIVPDVIKWPQEYRNIQLAYPDFKEWVVSGGTRKKTWWTNMDEEYIFP